MEGKKDEFIPSLTLDPNAAAVAQEPTAQAVAAVAAPAAETEIPVEKLEIERLSPAEQAAVREFASKIDITNAEQVLSYGSAAQKNIADFSGTALERVRTKDMGEIGDELSSLVVQLKGMDFDEEQKKGLRGLFRKSARTSPRSRRSMTKPRPT